MEQGEAALRDLPLHPHTAAPHLPPSWRDISWRMIRPTPWSPGLQKAFWKSRGDLPTVYRALIDFARGLAMPPAKFKTPTDYIYSRRIARWSCRRRAAGGSARLRTAGPASLPAGFARGMAGSQRGLGWFGRAAQATGMGAGARPAPGQLTRNAAQVADAALGGVLSVATRTGIAARAGWRRRH